MSFFAVLDHRLLSIRRPPSTEFWNLVFLQRLFLFKFWSTLNRFCFRWFFDVWSLNLVLRKDRWLNFDSYGWRFGLSLRDHLQVVLFALLLQRLNSGIHLGWSRNASCLRFLILDNATINGVDALKETLVSLYWCSTNWDYFFVMVFWCSCLVFLILRSPWRTWLVDAALWNNQLPTVYRGSQKLLLLILSNIVVVNVSWETVELRVEMLVLIHRLGTEVVDVVQFLEGTWLHLLTLVGRSSILLIADVFSLLSI